MQAVSHQGELATAKLLPSPCLPSFVESLRTKPSMPLEKGSTFAAAHYLPSLETITAEGFERVTRVAVHCFKVPIALIALVEGNRQRVRISQGLSIDEAQKLHLFFNGTSGEDVAIVPDTQLDSHWINNPAFGRGIRFYAGCCLTDTGGNQIGTFCVMDYCPRQLNASEVEVLRDLAAWVQTELNLQGGILPSDRLLTLVPDLVCTIKLNGYFHYLNPAWEKILGWNGTQLLATPYLEFIHLDDRETTQKKIESLQHRFYPEYETGSSQSSHEQLPIPNPPSSIPHKDIICFENRFRCQDGYYRWLSWHARYFPEQELVEVAIRDITELKAAEKELIQQFEQLQSVYHWADMVEKVSRASTIEEIYELSLTGLKRVLNADRAAISIFDKDGGMMFQVGQGLSGNFRRSLARYSIWPLQVSEPQPFLIPNVADALDLGEMQSHLLNEGVRACAWIPLVSQGNLIGRFGVYYDQIHKFDEEEVHLAETFADYIVFAIERKQAESALKRSQTELREKATELELTLAELRRNKTQLIQSEKMSSLGQLVAGIAHEINNPVNFIYGNLSHATDYIQDLLKLLQLYQRHYPNPDSEIQAEAEAIELDFLIYDLPKLLSSMKVGAERIQKIVLSLRNFSRMDEAEVKPVNIHEGIDSTLLILQNRLKAKPNSSGIQVIKNYGDLPLIECYPGQLNQVFMNIISNAIDAIEEKANLSKNLELNTQEPSTIRIGTELSNSNEVIIKIADNGTGIPENIQRRLFDPFFTTKPVGSGTGLGLSISYQIVAETHGGQLQCNSCVGKGTEFLIKIPLNQKNK
jgi:signal transduction histidine kinase